MARDAPLYSRSVRHKRPYVWQYLCFTPPCYNSLAPIGCVGLDSVTKMSRTTDFELLFSSSKKRIILDGYCDSYLLQILIHDFYRMIFSGGFLSFFRLGTGT